MSAHDDIPSDCEPDTNVRRLFRAYQHARSRYEGGNVIEFRPHLRHQQQLAHDLANAFRSTEAAGKYDDGGVP